MEIQHHILECFRCQNRSKTIGIIQQKLGVEVDLDNGLKQIDNLERYIEECTYGIDNQQQFVMYNVRTVLVKVDQYETSYLLIEDESQRQLLKKYVTLCARKGLYFPYGYGDDKNQLKMKGNVSAESFRGPVNLIFHRWKYCGKEGFSCKISAISASQMSQGSQRI